MNMNKGSMIGAIVGDIVGARFEWQNRKSKLLSECLL